MSIREIFLQIQYFRNRSLQPLPGCYESCTTYNGTLHITQQILLNNYVDATLERSHFLRMRGTVRNTVGVPSGQVHLPTTGNLSELQREDKSDPEKRCQEISPPHLPETENESFD